MALEKRIVNIRVMFVIFCGLILGIIVSRIFLLSNANYLITIVVILALVCVFMFFYGVFTEKENKKHRFRENVSFLIKTSSVSFVIAFLVGVCLVIVPILNTYYLNAYTDNVTVSGVVSDYIEDNSTYKKFILDNCYVNSSTGEKQLDYKIVVYTEKVSWVTLGDKVTFVGNLDPYSPIQNNEFDKIVQNIGYSTYVSISDMVIDDGSPTIKDSIKNSTRLLLEDNLNQDNASIIFAILFGEKQGLSENTSTMFSYAGISHILAVSGLHIGVLVSIIYFILKRIKINKYVKLAILISVLLFYSYLCSFTPSVCRASIMATLVFMCKDIFRIEYDAVSSLSIAGILILLISPLQLFTISFQLSFLCVFAIITLAPTLTNFLKSIKLPNFLASGLAVSIATNIVILPICMNIFTNVSMLGVIANIFILPIFSITYVLIFVISFLGIIFDFFGTLLFLPNIFLHLIKVIADYISQIPFGIFKFFNVSYLLLILVMLFSLTIHFFMVKVYKKSFLLATIFSFIIAIFIINLIPTNYKGNNIIIYNQNDSNVVFYIKNDSITMIGSDIDNYKLDLIMKDLRINKIDTVIAYDLQLNEIDNFSKLCNEYNVEKIYIPDNYNHFSLKDKFNAVSIKNDCVVNGDLKINIIYHMNEIVAVESQFDSKRFIIISQNNSSISKTYLSNEYLDSEYFYINDLKGYDLLSQSKGEIISKFNNNKFDNLVTLDTIGKYLISWE